MSAQIRCLACHWQSRQGDDAIEAYMTHWCVTADELEVTDEDWQAFLGRLQHPSMGGDVA
ncbi:MAG: hypothetical protein KGR18_10095 [Acidobacteria bacterium]|nr:hypothetical protein [Acidobacteriota bacterium]